jgi:hypothetical protein
MPTSGLSGDATKYSQWSAKGQPLWTRRETRIEVAFGGVAGMLRVGWLVSWLVFGLEAVGWGCVVWVGKMDGGGGGGGGGGGETGMVNFDYRRKLACLVENEVEVWVVGCGVLFRLQSRLALLGTGNARLWG